MWVESTYSLLSSLASSRVLRVDYKVLLYLYKALHGRPPPYVYEIVAKYHKPKIRTKRCLVRSFLYTSAMLRNCLCNNWLKEVDWMLIFSIITFLQPHSSSFVSVYITTLCCLYLCFYFCICILRCIIYICLQIAYLICVK